MGFGCGFICGITLIIVIWIIVSIFKERIKFKIGQSIVKFSEKHFLNSEKIKERFRKLISK